MTLAQFEHLRQKLIPSMIQRTSKLLELEMFRDQTTLIEVLGNMDEIVFRDYIRRKLEPLGAVITDGILRSGIDWLNTGKPTGMSCLISTLSPLSSMSSHQGHAEQKAKRAEVRPYMYKAILLLVDTHAKIGDIAPGLLSRVIEALVAGITEVALRGFQQVPKFGTGGMLIVRSPLPLFVILAVERREHDLP